MPEASDGPIAAPEQPARDQAHGYRRWAWRAAPHIAAPFLLAIVVPTAAQESVTSTASAPAAATRQLGAVTFETSCAPEVRDRFNHAVALLHSFEYDEAVDAFRAVSDNDSTCAMAAWGEAMARYHGLWSAYNAAEGAKAVAEARRRASANPATTQREKDYIAAISEIFSDEARKASDREDNKPDASGYSEPARPPQMKYRAKMEALHETYPQDVEATIFYALALNITAARSDRTQTDLRQCTALLKPLFVTLPNHPGIAHYIIHCSDNAEMAAGGLEAARKYAQIAPASAHATHMPSHIFAELGLWDEMVASNRESLNAAEADAQASPCEKVGHRLHAMYFLAVALAARGQLNDSRAVVDQALQVSGIPCDQEPTVVLAGYVMETGEWGRARDVKVRGRNGPVVDSILWMTIGVGAARTGDSAQAKAAEDKLAEMRDARAKLPGQTMENRFEMLRLAVAAWSAYSTGQKDEALRMLRDAADLQDKLGSDNPVFKPIREMLADMLALAGRPKDARIEYEAVLRRHPNRFDSTFGAAAAAEASGDPEAAKKHYAELLAFAHGDQRAELVTARKELGHDPRASTP